MKAHKDYFCRCVICRHNRGEISDEYFRGFMQASIDEQTAFLRNMKELGYKPTSLSDKGIGGLLAAISYDLDSNAQAVTDQKL